MRLSTSPLVTPILCSRSLWAAIVGSFARVSKALSRICATVEMPASGFVGEVGVGASDGFARGQMLCLERLAIRGQDEAGLASDRGWTGLQLRQTSRGRAGLGGDNVEVVGLKNAVQIGLVGVARPQTAQGRFLGAERLQKLEWKFSLVERLLRQVRDSLFDLNRVQAPIPTTLGASIASGERNCVGARSPVANELLKPP